MESSVQSNDEEMIVKRVSVPLGLEELMEGLTKEVILKKPKDIYVFASEYFAHLLNLREKGSFPVAGRKLQSVSKQIPSNNDIRGRNFKSKSVDSARQLIKQKTIRSESSAKKILTTKKLVLNTKDDKSESSTDKTRNFLDKRKSRRNSRDDLRQARKMSMEQENRKEKKSPRSNEDEKSKPKVEESKIKTKRSPRDGSNSNVKTGSTNKETIDKLGQIKKGSSKIIASEKEDVKQKDLEKQEVCKTMEEDDKIILEKEMQSTNVTENEKLTTATEPEGRNNDEVSIDEVDKIAINNEIETETNKSSFEEIKAKEVKIVNKVEDVNKPLEKTELENKTIADTKKVKVDEKSPPQENETKPQKEENDISIVTNKDEEGNKVTEISIKKDLIDNSQNQENTEEKKININTDFKDNSQDIHTKHENNIIGNLVIDKSDLKDDQNEVIHRTESQEKEQTENAHLEANSNDKPAKSLQSDSVNRNNTLTEKSEKGVQDPKKENVDHSSANEKSEVGTEIKDANEEKQNINIDKATSKSQAKNKPKENQKLTKTKSLSADKAKENINLKRVKSVDVNKNIMSDANSINLLNTSNTDGSFDPSKLREEIKDASELNLASFKTSYNPYKLRQEVKEASAEIKSDEPKNTFDKVASELAAAIKIQALWRGFKSRNRYKVSEKYVKNVPEKDGKNEDTMVNESSGNSAKQNIEKKENSTLNNEFLDAKNKDSLSKENKLDDEPIKPIENENKTEKETCNEPKTTEILTDNKNKKDGQNNINTETENSNKSIITKTEDEKRNVKTTERDKLETKPNKNTENITQTPKQLQDINKENNDNVSKSVISSEMLNKSKSEQEENTNKENVQLQNGDKQRVNEIKNQLKKTDMASAVLQIQALWRGFKTRKQLKYERFFGLTVKKETKIGEDLEIVHSKQDQHHRAVSRIQALWRGYKVRKNIKEVNDRIAELQKPTECDEMRSQRGLSDEDIFKAASKIQAGVRGYMVRKQQNVSILNSIAEESTDSVSPNVSDQDSVNNLTKIVSIADESNKATQRYTKIEDKVIDTNDKKVEDTLMKISTVQKNYSNKMIENYENKSVDKVDAYQSNVSSDSVVSNLHKNKDKEEILKKTLPNVEHDNTTEKDTNIDKGEKHNNATNDKDNILNKNLTNTEAITIKAEDINLEKPVDNVEKISVVNTQSTNVNKNNNTKNNLTNVVENKITVNNTKDTVDSKKNISSDETPIDVSTNKQKDNNLKILPQESTKITEKDTNRKSDTVDKDEAGQKIISLDNTKSDVKTADNEKNDSLKTSLSNESDSKNIVEQNTNLANNSADKTESNANKDNEDIIKTLSNADETAKVTQKDTNLKSDTVDKDDASQKNISLENTKSDVKTVNNEKKDSLKKSFSSDSDNKNIAEQNTNLANNSVDKTESNANKDNEEILKTLSNADETAEVTQKDTNLKCDTVDKDDASQKNIALENTKSDIKTVNNEKKDNLKKSFSSDSDSKNNAEPNTNLENKSADKIVSNANKNNKETLKTLPNADETTKVTQKDENFDDKTHDKNISAMSNQSAEANKKTEDILSSKTLKVDYEEAPTRPVTTDTIPENLIVNATEEIIKADNKQDIKKENIKLPPVLSNQNSSSSIDSVVTVICNDEAQSVDKELDEERSEAVNPSDKKNHDHNLSNTMDSDQKQEVKDRNLDNPEDVIKNDNKVASLEENKIHNDNKIEDLTKIKENISKEKVDSKPANVSDNLLKDYSTTKSTTGAEENKAPNNSLDKSKEEKERTNEIKIKTENLVDGNNQNTISPQSNNKLNIDALEKEIVKRHISAVSNVEIKKKDEKENLNTLDAQNNLENYTPQKQLSEIKEDCLVDHTKGTSVNKDKSNINDDDKCKESNNVSEKKEKVDNVETRHKVFNIDDKIKDAEKEFIKNNKFDLTAADRMKENIPDNKLSKNESHNDKEDTVDKQNVQKNHIKTSEKQTSEREVFSEDKLTKDVPTIDKLDNQKTITVDNENNRLSKAGSVDKTDKIDKHSVNKEEVKLDASENEKISNTSDKSSSQTKNNDIIDNAPEVKDSKSLKEITSDNKLSKEEKVIDDNKENAKTKVLVKDETDKKSDDKITLVDIEKNVEESQEARRDENIDQSSEKLKVNIVKQSQKIDNFETDGKISKEKNTAKEEKSVPSEDKPKSETKPKQSKEKSFGVNLIHSGEFHDALTVPISINSTKKPENVQAKAAPSGLINSGELHDNVLPISVQLDEAPPAGAAALTSAEPPIGGVERAQASNKGASTCEFEAEASPSSMETEKRNNANLQKKNMEAEAATKIQAGFRGYQVRKQLKNKISSPGDISNQRRSTRRKSSGRLTESGRIMQSKAKTQETEIEEKSAVKIQAGVRGFLVRRRQKKQKQGKESS